MMECFKIYADEIEGRIDPFYLKNKLILEDLQPQLKLVRLGSLLKRKVQYGANESAIDGNPKEDVRYIRITDIDEFGNLKDDDWKTSQNIEKKYILNEGDVLFARSGATVGKCFFYKNEYKKSIFAGYLIRFIFDEKKVNPKYVFYYSQLKRYKLWVISIQRPSGQPNINSEEFKSFKIPFPSLEVQNHIVNIMNKAYKIKKQKEIEAKRLLHSINDYFLDELDIKLPELKDKMCYVVYVDDVKGKRADTYYHQLKYEQVEEVIKKGKFKVKELKDVFYSRLVKGILPKQEDKVGPNKVLQIKNIQTNGIINITDFVTSKNIFSEEQKLKQGDIIIVITGATIGKVGLWNNREEFYLGGDMVKFYCSEKVDHYFIQSFLLSDIGQLQILRNTTGATNKHLAPSDIERIKIPLPPLSFQNKIANEVKRKIQRAKRLFEEAKNVLEEAKLKVERIILGEE